MSLFLQIDDSLNFLTQFTQLMWNILKYDDIITYTNIITAIKNFVFSKRISYAHIVLI